MKMEYNYKEDYCPIPPSEQFERTITAEKFHLVTKEKPKHLEGICFDRNGDMYFTSTYEGAVYFVDMKTGKQTLKWQDKDLKAASVKLHKDGRMFISCIGTEKKSGRIVVARQDGTTEREIAAGMNIDDVVFDHEGGFYFTHFVGTVNNPIGGIYYVSPSLDEMKCVIPNLCGPNGVCLSTDEKVMWITEFTAGRLLRVPMNNPGLASVVYQFTGYYGPDSCSIDEDDNVYVALFEQGRVMVFNKTGYPIGQILMPNRDIGHNLSSTHPMVRPDTKELYITTADDVGDEGSWIMKAPAFGKGNKNAYQFL